MRSDTAVLVNEAKYHLEGSFIIPVYPPPPFVSPIALDYNGPHRSDQG